LAEVDLGVDDAGQDGQARRVEGLASRGLRQVADVGDAAVDDADVGGAAAGVVGDLAAANDQIIGPGHAPAFTRSASSLRAALRTRSTGTSFRCWMAWFRPGSILRNSATERGPRTTTPPHGPRTASSEGPKAATTGARAAVARCVHRESPPR